MPKITELPLADAVDGSEALPLVQAGIARRATIAQILGGAFGPIITAAVEEAVAELIAGGTVSASWADITGKPSTFAPSAHTHEIGDVSGLSAALDALAALGGAPALAALVTMTGVSASLDPENQGKYQRWTNAAAKTLTVQANSLTAQPVDGEWHIRNVGTADLTIVAASGVTIHAPSGGTLLIPQHGTATLKRVAVDEFDLFGVTVAA